MSGNEIVIGPRTDKQMEAIVVTSGVRAWRRVRPFFVTIFLIVAYGLGVVSGTSGHYSDGIAELQRLFRVESGDDGFLAHAFDALGRLDAVVGIDATQTRHGVGRSISDLGDLCETQLKDVTSNVQARVTAGMIRINSGVAASSLEIEKLSNRINALDERSASTEAFCAQTFAMMYGILNTSRDQAPTIRSTE